MVIRSFINLFLIFLSMGFQYLPKLFHHKALLIKENLLDFLFLDVALVNTGGNLIDARYNTVALFSAESVLMKQHINQNYLE